MVGDLHTNIKVSLLYIYQRKAHHWESLLEHRWEGTAAHLVGPSILAAGILQDQAETEVVLRKWLMSPAKKKRRSTTHARQILEGVPRIPWADRRTLEVGHPSAAGRIRILLAADHQRIRTKR
jgi:hypothetical protein